MRFLGLVTPHLCYKSPPSLEFCDFYCGVHTPSKWAAGLVHPLCSCTSAHHHHLVVVFQPPQWSPLPQACFLQPPSYHTFYFDHSFDLGTPGSHLNQAHKLVPFFSQLAKVHVLIVGLLLILWSQLAFSSLYKF